ncbi:PblB [Streptococcus pneumoniae]|nr:PblB [Streptococcus pneumoniae]
MLYLLNKDVRTVRWNGEPLHEATSAIVKEIMNGDFTLTVKYPISDSGIYQLIQEDMLIKAPTPVLGAQLFRIKKPVEYNDHLEITAYHISDDVMQRSITPVSVTSQSCGMALSRMVQNTKTALGDFSFNSDIQDRRTFNTTETETLYSILLDGKHSIVGTWEGELVRDNFAITVKKSRGENRGVVITTHKNLKNYQRTKNSQNVVTRIHAKSTFKPEGAEKETTIRVTVDSPLINSYPYINEKEYENNNAKTVEELQKWAQSKFSNEGIDKVSDAIKIEAYELDGQVVHMGDTVNLKSWKHNVDAFKKAIAYEFDALKEEYISLTFDDKAGIGGSRASGGLSSAADAILGVTESAQEIALEKALQNADLDFDHKAGLLRQEISDDIELAKAKAEEVKRELSDTINQRFNSFDNGPLKETKRKAEEALRQAGASSSLAQEAKRIGLDSVARLEAFKSQTTSAQTALSGDLDALKRTIVNDIRPKQAQVEAEIAKQAEALSRTKNELAGASSSLAQEAKRIELDSVARLEAFKSQTTSAQTALSGDLDVLKRTIANDIRPKQAQAEAEIAKQVEALSRTKNELAGVKSAQATYKETTTRRLSELTNLANGKASKSELTQTAEELASRIASVQASGRNLFLNSLFKQDIPKTGIWTTSTYTATIDSESKYLGHKALKIIGLNPSGRDGGNPKVTYPALGQFGKVIPGSTTNQDVTISFYAKANKNGIMLRSRLGNIGYKAGNVTLSTEIKRYVVHIPKGWTNESKQTTNEWLFNFNQEGTIWIWMPKFEISDVDTSYSEAPEDIEGQISTVESTFKQRANSLEAGVSRLTEGLRTKADISSLNVTAENIRQSVKSLETDTQNKLNQKLSQAEFEVRAGSIRQEILNATKDKASKSELTQTAEELASRIASVKVGGRNYYRDSEKIRTSTRFFSFPLHPYLSQENVGETWTLSFDLKINEGGEIRPLLFYHYQTNRFGLKASADITPSKEWQRFTFTGPVIFPNDDPRYSRGEMALYDHGGNNNYSVRRIKLEKGTLATDWSPAPEDIEGQISTVESTFKQRANSLEAGVNRLTEGLRTKVDISALNVTAENIRQSVKSLETDTQNKLNQKLSQAEFEVRAGSIRQEILNATKDKASKSELTQTAEELSSKIASVQVGGRNYIRNGQFKNGSKNWLEYQSVNFGLNFNYQHSQNPNNRNRSGLHFYHDSQDVANFFGIQQSFAFDGIRGEKVSVSLLVSKDGSDSYSGLKVALHYIKNKNIIGQEWQNIPSPQITSKYKRFTFTFTLSDDVENLNLMLFGEKGKTINLYVTDVQLERGSVATDYKEAPEDIEGQISTVESNFKQRADSLEAGVSRLTEGLRTKVDISALNVTAENIRQSVKSLETDTQNKLNQKLSQAEFEVRAGSIRQEILNATKDKASKSELTQTAEELASRIASVKVGGRNYYRDSEKIRTSTRFFSFPLHPYLSQENVGETWTLSFDLKINEGGEIRPLLFYHYQTNRFGLKASADITPSKEWQRFTFTGPVIFPNDDPRYSRGEMALYDHGGNNNYSVRRIKLEKGTLATDWSPAPEDIEGQISTVESTFKQRANSLEAGVNRLTEGLRTKVDISALNVTAENIRQSVKSLETDTQNKLNQKLSQAEFEVRAGSIRQEILNATKDKASKSELTQTAEELASRIASVKVGGRNYYRDSEKIRTSTRFFSFPLHPYLSQENVGETWTLSFDLKINEGGEIRPLLFYHYQTNRFGLKASADITPSKEWQRFTFTGPVIFPNDDPRYSRGEMALYDHGGNNNYSVRRIKLEKGTLATDWSPAPEDIEGQISTVESTFKQRANSLDAGVSRLTEGLRTKVDISALNVTAENIRQSVKSLETDTQNKLNQKLSQAEFEVRAGSIRQEILNATKDKADKTLVVSEAGKLREEFSKMKVGGRNLWIKSKTVGAVIEKLPENHVTGQKECYRLENNSTLTFNLEPDFSSRLYQKVTFSAWVKYENVVQGRNFWNVFNCFKHYLFRKNSETGVQSGPDYATLGMYKGSADWKYITFTYDYSEKTNFDQLKTSLRFNLEGATSGTAWVTGIKVEIGSVATDWSPAPEDADGLITEAKATFERTAQGLRTDLSAIQEYVNKDGQRQEALQRYTREESTRQATAVRELVNRDFVGKATYQEDVKGINQRIEAVKTSANKDIASQIASYRQSVDGKFTDISSQITTYKQDVGGQISGLSNRLTSSEQGTTTQISNLSNRINSNKQGTDNQISNLKTQVATNKANADSQFANVTNQLARKVETTDFQRVKETSKLYERILGNTENGIADKVARMALTNQLFQVEVAKNASNGQNLLKGTKDFSGGWKNKGANWKKHAEKYKGVDVLFKNNSWNGVGQEIDAKIGEVYTFSLWMKSDWKNDTVNFYVNRNGSVEKGWGVPSETSVAITSEWKRYSFTFKITVDGFIFPRVERLNQNTNLYIAGLKLEKGSYATPYTEAPEDTDEAIRSVQSQLTGSWAVQNINSAGDIISGINLGANGHNRFVGKLTHITGETLIDRAVIKSAMVDKLKTANFEAGSVTTTILDAEAVTAEKLKVDDALIRKLTAKDAFIDRLTSKRIFSTKVESVISSSTFLEAYQGRIGGFTLGQFDQGGGRWISGVNQFSVGMGNGAGHGVRTAFWANWGNNWNYAGPKAWNVNTDGKMYCRNEVGFYDQVDFSNSSRANFYGNTTFSRSPVFSNGIELGSKDVLGDGWNPKGGRNAVVWWNQVGSGSVKYWMEQKSDRRLKENITDTAVKALDKINRLRMVAFDFIENKKHEEIGLIAQEAETIVPKIVSRDPENPDGYLHIDYTALVPYLIKAIQELNQKIEKMEKTIA